MEEDDSLWTPLKKEKPKCCCMIVQFTVLLVHTVTIPTKEGAWSQRNRGSDVRFAPLPRARGGDVNTQK